MQIRKMTTEDAKQGGVLSSVSHNIKISKQISYKLIIALFLVTLLSACAESENQIETKTNCKSMQLDSYDFSYCHEAIEGSQSKDVIFYFHGLDGSEKTWSERNLRKDIQSPEKNLTANYPHVISVSFGSRWFLTDVSYIKKSRLKVFTESFLPKVPSILGFTPQKQILMGESMGGLNVLRLASEEPKLFDRVVVTCPALLAVGPYDSPTKMALFLFSHPYVDKGSLLMLVPYALTEFPTLFDWQNNNPLTLVESKDYQLPPVLLTSNDQDKFGVNVGTEIFANKLQAKKHSVQWIKETGGHCQHTPATYQQIREFLN